MQRWVAMLGVLLGAGVAGAGTQAAVDEVQGNLRSIEAAIWKGEVDAARLSYKEKARNRPGDVMLRVYLAWCDMPNDEAWNGLKAIAAINPEVPWVHLGMGRVYLRWKMPDQAEGAFNLATKARPNFQPALVGMGDVARFQKRHDEAVKRYREALAKGDDSEGRAGLGLALLEQGDTKAAQVELARAVELWPQNVPALAALVRLAKDEKNLASAVDLAAKLCELSPRDREARRLLADIRFELGQQELAAKDYEQVLRLGAADREVLSRLAGSYRELGKVDAETQALQRLTVLDKGSPEVPLRLADLAEAAGTLEEAEAQLLEAGARAPGRADILLRLGMLMEKADRPVAAAEAFVKAQAVGGAGADEAQVAVGRLMERFRVKPVKGSVERIYAQVSASLLRLYGERLREKPGLEGTLKARVKVGADGKAAAVDLVEDSVNDGVLAGHVHFSLRGAEYPKQKREPVFSFDLRPPSKGR